MSDKRSWVCLVCGYVHHGEEPPESCPVCGAPATEFEPYEKSEAVHTTEASQWRCLICGYIHDGNAPPDSCPVCAASADDFEACAPAASSLAAAADDTRKIVIVGAGIAGVSAAEAVREHMPNAEILLLSKESELPYYRLNLTRFLAGEIDDDALPMYPRSWYEERRIELRLGAEVASIDPDGHEAALKDGTCEHFDKLVLACGAHPFLPPIPGVDSPGVTAIRTADDARALLERVSDGTPCACIGGGILGLETAGALARRGARVTLFESFGHLLPRQLNHAAARLLESHVENLGIRIQRNARISAVSGAAPALSVDLASGDAVPAEVVTVTTGIRSNTHLARKAGLMVKSGIVVDAHLAASHPDIFAVGDAAEFGGIVSGLWEPARYQGSIAGMNAAGGRAEFGGLPRMNTLKVLGLHMFSIGVIQPEDGSYQEVAEEQEGVYRRFLFHDNRLVGAILVGDTAAAAGISRAMKESVDFSDLLTEQPAASSIAEYLAGK